MPAQQQSRPGTSLAHQQQRLQEVNSSLVAWKGKINQALPVAMRKYLTGDRMLALCLTTFQKNPKILECTTQSIVAAVMQSARLGLEIGGHRGQGHLVPYEDSKSGKKY